MAERGCYFLLFWASGFFFGATEGRCYFVLLWDKPHQFIYFSVHRNRKYLRGSTGIKAGCKGGVSDVMLSVDPKPCGSYIYFEGERASVR